MSWFEFSLSSVFSVPLVVNKARISLTTETREFTARPPGLQEWSRLEPFNEPAEQAEA